LDLESERLSSCIIDTSVIDVHKSYDDLSCGVCEAGNVMKFNPDDASYQCEECPEGLYSERQTVVLRNVS
jgi:hypothetical protein